MVEKDSDEYWKNNRVTEFQLDNIFSRNYDYEHRLVSNEDLNNLVQDIENELNIIIKNDTSHIKITEIYPKNMEYEYAKDNGYIYTLYYDINMIRQPSIFWFSVGDILYIKLNNGEEVYFVPFTYPIIDIRSSSTNDINIHFDTQEIFFSSFTSWYEDIFRIHNFIGFNITTNKIVTSSDFNINIDFIASKVQKPKSDFNNSEFLYIVKNLFQKGIPWNKIMMRINQTRLETDEIEKVQYALNDLF